MFRVSVSCIEGLGPELIAPIVGPCAGFAGRSGGIKIVTVWVFYTRANVDVIVQLGIFRHVFV
jgi:hypothetical protein